MLLINKFCRDKEGATALEFAMLAIPFMFLVLGIIEIGFLFGAASFLEGGTLVSSRLIRTGQVQGGADPEAAFAAALCDNVDMLLRCSDLIYEVVLIPGDTFLGTGEFPPAFDADGLLVSSGFNPGEQNDVILIRTFYNYPFLTPLVGGFLGQGGRNSRMLLSTVVLRNEPYES